MIEENLACVEIIWNSTTAANSPLAPYWWYEYYKYPIPVQQN